MPKPLAGKQNLHKSPQISTKQSVMAANWGDKRKVQITEIRLFAYCDYKAVWKSPSQLRIMLNINVPQCKNLHQSTTDLQIQLQVIRAKQNISRDFIVDDVW